MYRQVVAYVNCLRHLCEYVGVCVCGGCVCVFTRKKNVDFPKNGLSFSRALPQISASLGE